MKFIDPDGRRIFFTKELSDTVENRGTIRLYNLLRYQAHECCKQAWGTEVESKLKETAKAHTEILERYINEGGYHYDDGQVNWVIRLKMIIITDAPYTNEDHAKSRRATTTGDELLNEFANYDVNGEFGAWSPVSVVCKRRDPKLGEAYNSSEIPAVDPDWNWSHEVILAHELIGDLLNNRDEINRGEARWADDLRGRLERPIEPTSIMSYEPSASRFFDRHFAAGVDDRSNITGGELLGTDNTSLLDISDPWFRGPAAEITLRRIRSILGL